MTTGLTPALEYHVVNSLGWPDLRPLQREAVAPVRRGDDCLLLAPTAGGKTEAAVFPLLSQMADENWHGLSVLYITPLRALLNNLHPRLTTYATWLGRTVGLWHGDVGDSERRAMLADPPDILLTTPESIEAMLVSRRVDHRYLFGAVRAVVVDELHAFAGDDRGWHLQGVLERVQHLAGRRLQRIGLSATIGNPEELLEWLAGGTPAPMSSVVSPDADTTAATPEITLDYVGTVDNAAMVISMLHRGEKRLAFCDSRAQAESLAVALRARDVTTFVSHSSLSPQERRRSEAAFAEARDCVVVATSTLELGIDVGDLDRVIQLDAPRTVASFLQRLGRTGRRPGSSRNCLFLATRLDALLSAAALLHLWGSGYVEPVQPPPHPRHITAQQLLAVALQEGRFGTRTWQQWWPGSSLMDDGEEILAWLLEAGFLASDSGLAFIGDEAEKHFGRRHFMDLLAVFTAEPELSVIHGRQPVGSVSPLALTAPLPPEAPRVLLLAGRPWRVTHTDWRARTVSVVEHIGGGRSMWMGGRPQVSQSLSAAMRSVLLGADPSVEISQRAASGLASLRDELAGTVDDAGVVLQTDAAHARWWTWAGTRANATLAAAMEDQGRQATFDHAHITVDGGVGPQDLRRAAARLDDDPPVKPHVDQAALEGLKFSAALPLPLATATLAERLGDPTGAKQALDEPLVLVQGRPSP